MRTDEQIDMANLLGAFLQLVVVNAHKHSIPDSRKKHAAFS